MCSRTVSGGIPRSAWLTTSMCAGRDGAARLGALLRLLHQQVDQERVVDLQDQARVDDRQVLLAQRLGDREHVLLVGSGSAR